MVDRVDIERALADIVSNEEGMRFQSLAVVLAKQRWPELIACERHNDLGLDAHVHPLAADGAGKGLACSTTGEFSKLNRDAKTAKEHYDNDLSLLIFATLAKVTQDAQADWREKIRASPGLELVVLSREDFITELQKPANLALCRSHLRLAIPYETPIEELLEKAHVASATVVAEWSAHPRLAGQPQITLDVLALDARGNETGERFPTTEIRGLLLQGRRVVIEAPAGRGKTTTLAQIANGGTSGIPLLVDLPAWVRSRADILDYVAQRPAFRSQGVTATDLARLATAEPLLFLLNGWNEVPEAHAGDAITALADLERAFPSAGIFVATRPHHVLPPLPGAARLQLLVLTSDQRAQYIRRALPVEEAQALHAALIADDVLDDLTRTPLILAEVTNLFRLGREIPRTKLGVLGAVVALTEELEHHRGPLQATPLFGRADAYLSALGLELTERGDALLSDEDARAVCSAVSDQLRVAGQIAAIPEPSQILVTLAAHHLLERVGYPTPSFRFEHQQFQEYYAATALRHKLVGILVSNEEAQLRAYARTYLNVPAWEESLEMLADDLGESNEDVAIGRTLVERALPIDPVFAARLARLGGPHVWADVRTAIHARLRSLQSSPNTSDQKCAVVAMLATASPEFADVVVPRLTSPDPQVRHATYSAAVDLYPSSVGVDWPSVVGGWLEERRIEFMSQLSLRRAQLEVASTLARVDPSPSVRVEAIRNLAWMRQQGEVARLLRSTPDPEFMQAIEHTDLSELPADLRERAFACYSVQLAAAGDAKVRYQLALRLAEQRHPQGEDRLKDELTKLSAALVRELSNFSLRHAVEAVRRIDARWVSEWVAYWIVEGALWPDWWLPFVTEIPDALREEWLGRAASDEAQQGGVVSVLAATADASLGRRAFELLRDQRRAVRTDPRNEREQALEHRLTTLVRTIPLETLVEGLTEMLADTPRDEDLDVLTSFLGDGRSADEKAASLSDTARAQLRRYLKAAMAAVLAREDFRGEAKARLSTALAEVGFAEDIDDAHVLLRADLERMRAGRRLLREDRRTPQSEGATMGWSHYHAQAVARLDPGRAEQILCDLLAEPEYERDAAWTLRDLAKHATAERRTFDNRFFGGPQPDYRNVRRTPREWEVLFDGARRAMYATGIRGRITNLLKTAREDPTLARENHWRAKELVKALAALDPYDSADLILDVAALPLSVDGWTPIGLLEPLVFAGVTLPADRVLSLTEPVVQRLRTYGTYNDNRRLLPHLMCILPFIDPSALGIARVRELVTEFRLAPHEQRELFPALAQCADAEGLVLLSEIARNGGDQFQHASREWLAAVAASPHPRARQLVLSFVDPSVPGGLSDLALPHDIITAVAETLATSAQHDLAIKARILELCDAPVSAQVRAVLAEACAQLGTLEALLAGLNLMDDAAAPPIPFALFEAIEAMFLEKRPSGRLANAYTLVPRAAAEVRAHLFELAMHDQRRRASAADLLARVEAWRLQYGRPASEPRHPAFDSGVSWPLPRVVNTTTQPPTSI